ncbi:efflux RND transporter periplasmic adaptor subunit [Hahella sp. CR1]|uniref:efflux RND transporter periplasmic adaptor subunit n=1 Tax=Hahella sp. CR1 TaxID=2992807 RepID=UPI00244114F9|nr:efflux RND transporter periplasmic adaptor subunit [Hahella sp. CR1]MDG9669212.1 efflux RND transporter periplasmic adaptor subunit [Hahella sp. CR1]
MRLVISLIFIVVAFVAGLFVSRHPALTALMGDIGAMGDMAAAESGGEKQPLYWVAPMDPNYRRDKPGKSPMGMDLVPVYEEDAQGKNDDGGVTINPTMEHNLGVRVAKVEQGQLTLPIHTVGYVAFDEDRLTHVHSRVEGWIEALNVKSSGDPVSKGQKLYEIYSPALVNAQEEYLAALRSNNRLLLKASSERLLALGLNAAQVSRLEKRRSVDQRISVYAEQSGVVDSLMVREGMFIKPATEVMSIGGLGQVWVIAEVFERQAGWVKAGQPVTMQVAAAPGRDWEGKVDYLYPVLDAKTRTLRVRVRFANPDLTLKPNMFANLTLRAKIDEQALSVPREAVIRTGSHDRVVLAAGDGRYRPAFVKLGVEADDRVQVLEGLKAGDQVVISGQFLIDSESKVDVALAALESSSQSTQQDTAPSTVWATGTINSVMAGHGMLNISHDPVKAWSWPSMDMDFTTVAGLPLDGVEPGQRVRFEITRNSPSDFQVTALDIIAAAPAAQTMNTKDAAKDAEMQAEMEADMQMDHDMDHDGAMPAEGAQ